MATIKCGPLTFTANFDSGNIGNAELVQGVDQDGMIEASSATSYFNAPDYEVNIYTKPDCDGTKYANGNRTWFNFGVKGGKSNGVLKMNILNLNKQTKLFEQGHQPVTCCIPERPRWERIKDRVVILERGVKEQSCGISFRQKLPADTSNSTLFIAFTYPFSYANMRNWLNNIDDHYLYPSPMADHQLLKTSDVYYHRECVCVSLEGRRVDLLTITSSKGQLSIREDFLYNLFPFRHDQPRPHKFINKKVIFLSSRVHPGETPAQFVMNGVIKFLLDDTDPRAIMLRSLFVMKIIPILNPDGVSRGHYRTDPRGVNLNRVYLAPSPFLHPSIYASRKLILYAHFGHDTPDPYDYEVEQSPQATVDWSADERQKSQLDLESEQYNTTDNQNQSLQNNEGEIDEAEAESRLCAGCILPPPSTKNDIETENLVLVEDEDSLMSKTDDENLPLVPEEHEYPLRLQGSYTRLHHQCDTFESCDEDSIIDYQDIPKTHSLSQVRVSSSTSTIKEKNTCISSTPFPSASSSVTDIVHSGHPTILTAGTSRSARSQSPTKVSHGGSEVVTPTLPPVENTLKRSQAEGQAHAILQSTHVESGLFLYIDMHGHATKRGIFIYGNHFDDISVQTECMLLPRLFALNCQHFDFSACNFTERLMKLKDRRDGASREGSGRVAVLKLTGLIRSYTLECNYNTGRVVNHLITRPDSYGLNDQMVQSIHHPPKFTPELFEAAGKSLGESILDLTGVNPWSRLKSTEYHTLDGLRNFLQRRLQHTIDFKSTSIRSTLPVTVSLIPSGSISSTTATTTPPKEKGKICNVPTSPLLKLRRGSGKNIASSSSSASGSSGPLIPKKDNQTLVLPPTAAPGKTKSNAKGSKGCSFDKPTTSSKAKLKGKLSKTIPTEGQEEGGVPPSTSQPDNRPTLNKVLKISKKKKKKILKSKKTKKLKNFQDTNKRPDSRTELNKQKF